jgi:hypothetical protein
VAIGVTVQNIDTLGVLIPGETATLAASFTYIMPPLLADSALIRLIRTFILDMRAKTIPEVVHSWASDYYDRNLSLTELRLAQLPAIAVLGPAMPTNRFYSINKVSDDAESPTTFAMRHPPLTVDLKFTILGVSDKTIEGINLSNIVANYFNRTKSISMPKDPANLSKGLVVYEMDWSPFAEHEISISAKTSTSNLRQFSMTIEIRGFDFEELAGIDDDSIVGLGVAVDTVNVGAAGPASQVNVETEQIIG